MKIFENRRKEEETINIEELKNFQKEMIDLDNMIKDEELPPTSWTTLETSEDRKTTLETSEDRKTTLETSEHVLNSPRIEFNIDNLNKLLCDVNAKLSSITSKTTLETSEKDEIENDPISQSAVEKIRLESCELRKKYTRN